MMTDFTPQEPLKTPIGDFAFKPQATGRRIVSLWFPYWLVQSHGGGFDATRPFVLVDKQNNTQRVVAVTPLAETAGLHASMSLADARALVPDLQTAPVSWPAAQMKLEKTAKWLQRYTPWVGYDAPGD